MTLKWYRDYTDLHFSIVVLSDLPIMGPKRAETILKGHKSSQAAISALGMAGIGTIGEQGYQPHNSLVFKHKS